MKRILVDMSATLIHHGHVRLLRQAKMHGYVIVALTTDDEIEREKGYLPELSFESRKEILEAFRFVDEVIPSPWLINQDFLDQNSIDLLIHGADNSNVVDGSRILVLPRTPGVSSTLLRQRARAALERISRRGAEVTSGL